jgi:uncharacterized protein (DUF433 family)/DNA-binding transcriptional MerR regulator
MAALANQELWRKRLDIPAYQVGDAARYADISKQTVAAWHKIDQRLLTLKESRARLSYLQLIEMAVVAAFRKAGFPLKEIRAAREYVQTQLKSTHPFAEFSFKRYGKSLFTQFEAEGKANLIKANQAGQLAWQELIGPLLQEFEYEHEGLVLRWHVAGPNSAVIIDPRISFGVPSVRGTPTWIIKGRFEAGEHDSEIAEDFNLGVAEVKEALKFEGVLGGAKPKKWRVN